MRGVKGLSLVNVTTNGTRPRVLAVGNHKGGSSKSVTTVQLAAMLAERGMRVLVVDLDPQANASRRLGVRWSAELQQPTISEVIKADVDGIAADAIVPSGWEHPVGERVDVLMARWDLEARVSEAGTVGAVRRLARALAGVVDDYDLVLIDLPPRLDHLTQLGLAAADAALLVTEPEFDSIEGAVRVRDFIIAHAADIGRPQLNVAGVIVSRVRAQLGAHSYQLDGLPDVFGDLLWTPFVPERTILKDATDAAAPLAAYSGSAAGELRWVFGQLADRVEELTA
jgi:chromosome partitioning protein